MPFKDIIGHKNVISRLQRLIIDKHLPHALIFVGPEGIGKKMTAFGLTKALLCMADKKETDFCDNCPSCHKINQQNHPDVNLIAPEGASIKIGQLREWQETLESMSYMGSWRVTIIDNAEKMTQAAANSILKTLEEPPEKTIIFLITKETGDILPTILSRCQIIRFAPLSRKEFIQILIDKIRVSEVEAGLLYNLSRGQLLGAMSMDIKHVYKIRGHWKDFFTENLSNESMGLGKSQSTFLEDLNILASWIRDIIFVKLGVNVEMLTHQDILHEVKMAAQNTPQYLLLDRIDLVLNTIEAIEKNANIKIALDNLLFQWGKSPLFETTPG